MTEPTNIDDHRPHIRIQTKDKVHVIPEALFLDIIDGKVKTEDVDEWDEILPVILEYYLYILRINMVTEPSSS